MTLILFEPSSQLFQKNFEIILPFHYFNTFMYYFIMAHKLY